MTSTLAHRGPDDGGLWVDDGGRAAFGHRRLSIVDLSPEGHQPMTSADGRWTISYNGEVYNYRSLREQLHGEGLVFRGTSDTEVLVGAVERWGIERALEACEGMFAFALWDHRLRELHLVRDRFGEKPLYFGWVGDRLAFASELKALRALPDFAPELDRRSIALFLSRNCIPAPTTVYDGISKVLPGQWLTFNASNRRGDLPVSRQFWSARAAVERARSRPIAGSPDRMTDQLEVILSTAVESRMVADVPVGAFLSGGVDSSLVVALMQSLSSRAVRTFTVGFADRAFDESQEAARVAEHLGTDHTCLMVTDDDAAAVIPDLAGIWDEPFGDISQIPLLLVSRLARTQVTVALSGDGGDELFAGYNRHAWLERLWRYASHMPDPLRQATGSMLGRIPPDSVDAVARVTDHLPVRWQVRNPSTKVMKVGRVLAADDPRHAYLSLVSHWEHPESMVVGAGAGLQDQATSTDWPELSGITEQMLWLDLSGYLPDDILTKLDRASMATGLEARAPLLDRSVFDFAWGLPMDAKLRDGVTKWMLRQVLYRYVPSALVDRPKMGFGLPISSWLRGRLRPWAEELLDERRLTAQGLLDPVPIRLAWQQHISGRRDLGYELWDVLALQAWLDRWMPGLSS